MIAGGESPPFWGGQSRAAKVGRITTSHCTRRAATPLFCEVQL